MALFENYAYVADTLSGIQVVDIEAPASPEIVAGIDTPDPPINVFISGSYAYASIGYGILMYDISNSDSPVFF